ncbi:MAG: hypothetical protein FWB86_14800 [Treponema sp.]|nr:hypothetical protein [Treponema sp.]
MKRYKLVIFIKELFSMNYFKLLEESNRSAVVKNTRRKPCCNKMPAQDVPGSAQDVPGSAQAV